jgi:cell division protein FtsB
MKRFVINTLFLLLLCLVIAFTITGKRGFLHMIGLQQELHEIEKNNIKLKQENEKLKQEIMHLKNNLRYLEELSRNELGLARDGELIYRPEKKKQ